MSAIGRFGIRRGIGMAKNEKKSKSGAKLTRRRFIQLTGVSAASASVLNWRPLFAAQAARKRIIIHGERQVTSLGYHNRRDTQHVSMVDAGRVRRTPDHWERDTVLI